MQDFQFALASLAKIPHIIMHYLNQFNDRLLCKNPFNSCTICCLLPLHFLKCFKSEIYSICKITANCEKLCQMPESNACDNIRL